MKISNLGVHYILKALKAKKALGQHFLIDEDLSRKIAYSLQCLPTCKNVLEVGPGKGILTQYLLKQDFAFKVVELDKDMVSILTRSFADLQDRIIHLDFLKLDLRRIYNEKPFLLIGNFPYNISTEIIFKVLDNRELIPEVVGMFQKEVAERFISPHGNKVYGVTSVLTQAFYHGEKLFDVGPMSFNPPPKVDSAVIRLTRKENPIQCNHKLFKQVVKMGFSQRRKMLRNTLKTIVKNHDLFEDKVFTLRAEHLSVADFEALTNKIEESNESGN